MKKIITLSLLFLLANSSFAGLHAVNHHSMAKEPFSVNDHGIKYVDLSELNIPIELKKMMSASQEEMKKKGYIAKQNTYVNELMSIKKESARELRDAKKIRNPYDTHLKGSLEDIKLSFKYQGVPNLESKNVIGYAPAGGYRNSKGKPEGWTGIVEFFEDKELGTCAYDYNHILAIQLVRNTVKFLVNDKPTNLLIEGVPHNGFLYDVTWYTDTTISSLRCANKMFDKKIQGKMLELAKSIDLQQSSLTKSN